MATKTTKTDTKTTKAAKTTYDETLDVVLAEVEIDDKHTVQVRQYDGGAVKVGCFYVGKKKTVAMKRLPGSLAQQFAEAITKLIESGALSAEPAAAEEEEE